MKIDDGEMQLHHRPSSTLNKIQSRFLSTTSMDLWYWYTYLRRDAEVQIVTNKVAHDNNGYPTKSIVGRPPSYLARAVACNLYRQTCKVYIYISVRACDVMWWVWHAGVTPHPHTHSCSLSWCNTGQSAPGHRSSGRLTPGTVTEPLAGSGL